MIHSSAMFVTGTKARRFLTFFAPCAFASAVRAADVAPVNQENAAAAQVLFDEALDDLSNNRGVIACPKFRRSFELDPKGSTLSNLGACYESFNMTASAWASYEQLLVFGQKQNRPELVTKAEGKIATLKPKLIRVQVHVGSQPAGFKLLRNQAQVTEEQWASPILVDPGAQGFEASAPDHKPWKGFVAATEPGSTVTIEVPTLVAIPKEEKKRQQEQALHMREPSPLKVPAIILLGAGGAALIAGGVLGALASSAYDDAKAACAGATVAGRFVCPPSSDFARVEAKRDTANTFATASTIAFIGGGAMAATGMILFVLGSHKERSISIAPNVGVGSAGLVLGGSFQ